MSLNRRKAPFRYKLVDQYECLFKITRINNKIIDLDKPAVVTLADVSKFGCKVITNLDLNTQTNQIEVELQLEIDHQPQSVSIDGAIRWQTSESNLNYYGIKFENNEQEQVKIMSVLQTFASINLIKLI
jgi:hypothetical protein